MLVVLAHWGEGPAAEAHLNWEQIKADWQRYRGRAQDRWGRLTDDDLVQAQAGRNALIGCVQARYGIERGLAERHVDNWITSQG